MKYFKAGHKIVNSELSDSVYIVYMTVHNQDGVVIYAYSQDDKNDSITIKESDFNSWEIYDKIY